MPFSKVLEKIETQKNLMQYLNSNHPFHFFDSNRHAKHASVKVIVVVAIFSLPVSNSIISSN